MENFTSTIYTLNYNIFYTDNHTCQINHNQQCSEQLCKFVSNTLQGLDATSCTRYQSQTDTCSATPSKRTQTQFSSDPLWLARSELVKGFYLAMQPLWGPSPLRSSMTLCGWLFTTFPSSLPFQVPSSSLNDADLRTKHQTLTELNLQTQVS